MLKFTIKDSPVYTIPKENIGMLAYSKGYKGNIFDLDNAIKYLESLGVKFEEV